MLTGFGLIPIGQCIFVDSKMFSYFLIDRIIPSAHIYSYFNIKNELSRSFELVQKELFRKE